MTHADQHRLILELKDYQHKMSRRDSEQFEMFEKRDKDDEDLDDLSKKRLLEFYTVYVPERKRII